MLLLESRESSSSMTRHDCLAFLDEQHINSVIFVSFGTNTKCTQEQVNELALGLEQSNHKFIWVIRESDKKTDSEKFKEKDWNFKLPEGFQERVEGREMVPQLEILGDNLLCCSYSPKMSLNLCRILQYCITFERSDTH